MKKPKVIRTYRFRVEISGVQETFHVETSGSTRKEARDRVAWLTVQGYVPRRGVKITFCGIVATEEK